MNKNEEQFDRSYILAAIADMVNSGDLDDMPLYGRVSFHKPWFRSKALYRNTSCDFTRVDTLSLEDLLICYSECQRWVTRREALTAELKRQVKDIAKRYIND